MADTQSLQEMIEDLLDQEQVIHPGSLLRTMCRETQDELADMLGTSRLTVNHIMNAKRTITPNMAMRLEQIGYGSAREWLIVQMEYDLAKERERWQT